MIIYLLVALGGALGSVLRYWLSTVVTEPINATFPWGTFWVNVTGCLAIGFFASLTGPGGRSFATNETRIFLMTGVCGGYTTFSAFGLQSLNLLRAGDSSRAACYVIGSVVICIASVWVGHLLAGLFSPAR